MDDPAQTHRKLNEALVARVPDIAWECTTPIVVARDGTVFHHGTGTLFRVADHFFVVTAGHVIKQACEHGKTVGIGGSDGQFIALAGNTLVSSEDQYGTSADPFDIGLHLLTPDAVNRLSKKRFLNFNDIEFGPQSPTAIYTLFGFPAVWSSPSRSVDEIVKYKALEYTTYRYDGDTSMFGNYQESLHLLLDGQFDQATNLDASRAQFLDAGGKHVPFPEGLGGISGCSAWRIGDLKISPNKWCVEKSRLVAVQTGVYPQKRAIKATRWIAVSTLIYEAFEELRPAMGLWHVR